MRTLGALEVDLEMEGQWLAEGEREGEPVEDLLAAGVRDVDWHVVSVVEVEGEKEEEMVIEAHAVAVEQRVSVTLADSDAPSVLVVDAQRLALLDLDALRVADVEWEALCVADAEKCVEVERAAVRLLTLEAEVIGERLCEVDAEGLRELLGDALFERVAALLSVVLRDMLCDADGV